MPKTTKPTIDSREDLFRDGVVDISEAAKLLNVCRRTVQNMMDDGEIVFTRVRSKRLIPRVAIVRYLIANIVDATH